MTELIPLLTACSLRPIQIAGDQYAADLRKGIAEEINTPEKAADFLAATHLTAATKDFLHMATARTANGQAVYQLFSRYGGGKTHTLLMLAAAAMHPQLDYWANVAQCHPVAAKVIAFDGTDSSPYSGIQMPDQETRAKSLAGFIIYHLGGSGAFNTHREMDNQLGDPGAEEFKQLIGDQPVIIIIDELVQYISKVNQRASSDPTVSSDGTLSAISALAKAVANSPRAVLVITNPEESHDFMSGAQSTPTGDAYRAEALKLRDIMADVNSQLARAIQPFTPATDSDLSRILAKRLFSHIDPQAQRETSAAYAQAAAKNARPDARLTKESFCNAYPFHPFLLDIITTKLSANANFQRVRGTLRLIGNALTEMKRTNSQALLLHPHHLDPAIENVRQEIISRIGFQELDPAIEADITGPNNATAKTGDSLARPAAVTTLLGTIAPEPGNGLYFSEIADTLLSPQNDDYGVISNAVASFLQHAIYIDDSPNIQRKRFSKDANVMKELQELRDQIYADTATISNLFNKALIDVYGSDTQKEPSRKNRNSEQIDIVIFPSKQSNVPDSPDQATLGIVNPDFWNWTDASLQKNRMSNQDILDLHRHSSANNGSALRQYPNNAIFLAAHDSDLTSVYQQLATKEAASRLLNDQSRTLQEQRKMTLEATKADAEKNALTGIQSKFRHLFSAGNGNNQWPEPNSHLESRFLEPTTDAAGKGQNDIRQALSQRILFGTGAGLSKTAWSRIGLIANRQGSTLGELRAQFGRDPNLRIVINQPTWIAMIHDGIKNGAIHVVTQNGEENPNGGYDPQWQVWAKGHEPKPTPATPDAPTAKPAVSTPMTSTNSRPTTGSNATLPSNKEFTTSSESGKAAYESVKRFMENNGLQWSDLLSCIVSGTNPALANQIATIPQNNSEGVRITLLAKTLHTELELALQNLTPESFKRYATPVRQILKEAHINSVDVTVTVSQDAAESILSKLDNRIDAQISVVFR